MRSVGALLAAPGARHEVRRTKCDWHGAALALLGLMVISSLSQAATDPAPPPYPSPLRGGGEGGGAHPALLSVSARTAEEIADTVQATYRDFSDLQAGFIQRATNRLSGMTQEASGRLFLKWPGRMRWEYEKPESRLFLIDGKTLWSYSPSERQAVAQDVSGALTTSPVGILFGMSSLRRDFQIRPILHAGTKESREYLLELTPKAKDLSFQRVILGVDRESFLIQRLTVFDLYGNTTAIELSEQKVNGGLKDELFQFSPPPETDLVAPPKRPVP